MSTRKSEKSVYAMQVQHGFALANRKMMELAARFDRSLIISRDREHWMEVDAKQLLEEAHASAWWKEHFPE